MNDVALGQALRAIRHHLHLRQCDVAERSGVSQQLVSLIERGGLAQLSVRAARGIAAALGADLQVTIRWRGPELDRILDARHADLVGRIASLLDANGWLVATEVTYSIFGERGSIDVLAFHPPTGTLLVIEVKTQIVSVEETLRRHDEKVRLAARVARERLGWDATRGVRLLVIEDNRTARRRVETHASIFGRAYPVRGWAARAWLAAPASGAGLLLFLPPTNGTGARRGRPTIHRVRPTRSSTGSRS